jgi:pimeloyl-ACP methyl ester carboxylesterase
VVEASVNEARTVYLFVNGIATWPGNYTNWNKKAVTFTHTETEHRAEAFEYFCTWFTRPFREDERAKHFARSLREYAAKGWNIVCVGHSNGAAVILEGLRAARWPRVEAVHLVCGACEADFWRNGLNFALAADRIGHVCVYSAAQDWALRLAHSLPARLLGYGTLGLHGARNVRDTVRDRVGELWWKDYGHSTCWLPAHFENTMKRFFLPTPQLEPEAYGSRHLRSRHD